MAVYRSEVARQLRHLAGLAETNPDFVLSQIEALSDSLFNFAETTEMDPYVFINLDEVVNQLYLSLQNSDDIRQVGRPSYFLPMETVESYLVSGLTVHNIASLFGVCDRTIHRRLADHGMRLSDLCNSLGNRELDAMVREILSHHPNTGYKMMLGHLRARGIRIQRRRVIEFMHRIDPGAVRQRTLQLQTRRRRQYSVPASSKQFVAYRRQS